MRANEFTLAEANVFDKIGNAANKDVAAAKAGKRAKLRKKNVPVIAQSVTKILSHNLKQAEGDPAKIKEIVTKTMSKTLKVDVTKHPEEFSDSVEKLVNIMTYRTNDPDAILNHVQDVVDRSFDIKDRDMLQSSMTDLVKAVMRKVEEGNPNDWEQHLSESLDEAGFSEKEIKAILVMVAEEYKNALNEDRYTDALQKAMLTVLKDQTPGNVKITKPTTKPSSAKITGSTEDEPEPEQDDEGPSSTKTSTGVPIDKLRDALKELLIKDPDFATGDLDKDKRSAETQIDATFEKNGLRVDDPMHDETRDALLQDPDMPWNYEHPKKFRAQVYAPNGWRGDSIVYVWHEGKWHSYQVASAKSWIYKETITDPKEVMAIRAMIKNGSGSRKLRNFRHDQDGFYTVTDK